MKEPLLSLVMPNFNGGSLIEESIRSILASSSDNLEFIIVDGVSKDISFDIIQKYESSISKIIQESDDGQYDAINNGFLHSSGEIMGWLNSDDLFLPWTLKAITTIFMEYPEVDWITSTRPGWLSHSSSCASFRISSGFSKETFALGIHCPGHPNYRYAIQQESTFWRRSLWEKIGSKIPPEYPLAGDYALWTKMIGHSNPVNVEHPLACFRARKGQRSDLYKKEYEKEAQQCQKDHIDFFDSINLSSQRKQGSLKKLVQVGTEPRFYKAQKIHQIDINQPNASWRLAPYEIEISGINFSAQ